VAFAERQPDMLGRLPDTFVAAQLRAEIASSSNDPLLYHLREEQGRREIAGIILHTGPHVFPVSDRIIAAPVSALWS
jgi:uncharacterized protein